MIFINFRFSILLQSTTQIEDNIRYLGEKNKFPKKHLNFSIGRIDKNELDKMQISWRGFMCKLIHHM